MTKTRIKSFQPIGPAEERENEDEISQASRCMMDHIYIRANLPGLLARVALAGHPDKALDALIAWGTGRRPISELWKEMTPLAEKLNGQRGGNR